MYASLGTISFQVIASPTKLEQVNKFHFQKLDVIGAPPVLQWIFDDLQDLEINITLHQLWCDPAKATQSLMDLAKTHQQQTFVLGNGVNLGDYVITHMAVKQVWQADDGTTIASEIQLKLVSAVFSQPPAGSAPKPIIVGNPPAIVTIANNKPAVVVADDATVNQKLAAFTQAQADAAVLAYEGIAAYDFAIETAQLAAFGLSLFASPASASPSGQVVVPVFTDIALSTIARWSI